MKPASTLILFTDLDGTLLDHATYSPTGAEVMLDEAQRRGVSIIFCSSRTRAEVEALQARLHVRSPFIVENGGAIIVRDGTFPPGVIAGAERRGDEQIIALGLRYERLVAALRLLRAETGVRVVGFSDLTTAEVAAKAHLTLAEASLAKAREYDEPFQILNENGEAYELFERAVERAGLRLTRGGRFHHLHGRSGKGEAVARLIELYRQALGAVDTAALGDDENDLPMLSAVNRPMLVRRRDGSHDPAVIAALPAIELIDGIGPQGWGRAVRDLLVRKPAA